MHEKNYNQDFPNLGWAWDTQLPDIGRFLWDKRDSEMRKVLDDLFECKTTVIKLTDFHCLTARTDRHENTPSLSPWD